MINENNNNSNNNNDNNYYYHLKDLFVFVGLFSFKFYVKELLVVMDKHVFLFNTQREIQTYMHTHTHLFIYWFMYTWFLEKKWEKGYLNTNKKKEIEVDNNPVEKWTWRLMVVKGLINVINITIYSWLNICTNTENISKMTQISKIYLLDNSIYNTQYMKVNSILYIS